MWMKVENRTTTVVVLAQLSRVLSQEKKQDGQEGVDRRTWMKRENRMTTTRVWVKLFSSLPTPMQKAAPMDMQSHSQKRRPRMPRCLPAKSEIMPPLGREMMLHSPKMAAWGYKTMSTVRLIVPYQQADGWVSYRLCGGPLAVCRQGDSRAHAQAQAGLQPERAHETPEVDSGCLRKSATQAHLQSCRRR